MFSYEDTSKSDAVSFLHFFQFNQTLFIHPLEGFQNPYFRMIPSQTTLEVNRVRRTQRAIGTQFNGRTLHKSPCCHDNIAVVTRHCVRFGAHIAVHRCSCLNPFTESNESFRCAQFHCLNDVMTAFCAVRNYFKAQSFIDICRKDSTFQRTSCNSGRKGKIPDTKNA